jgi:cytochrome c oxidase assembly protein subunit 15
MASISVSSLHGAAPAAGAHRGAPLSRSAVSRSRWPQRLAVVTAGLTLLLIFVGGVVTNTGSALAVPDWPTTFGHNMFLYPWSQMVGGILYEHSHRLIGSAVGALTIALAVSLWWTEPRRWVRRLGLAAVAAVIVQGILGGLRVVLLEHGLAIVHGCVAQGFLALVVGLAVVTSPTWQAPAGSTRLADPARLRALALLTASLVYAQLVFGAVLTHTGSRLDAHVLFAALVTLSIGILVRRVLRHSASHAVLRRPAMLLLALLAVQLSLGLAAYAWRFTSASASMPPLLGLALLTTHRLTGAALWGTSVVLVLRILRLAGVERMVADRSGAGRHSLPGRLGAGRDQEVLA